MEPQTANIEAIEFSKLILDQDNPRFHRRQESQRDAIEQMMLVEGKHMYELALDIGRNGRDRSELPIVIAGEEGTDEEGKYVVLDGNRRLVAYKLLQNPSFAEGHIGPKLLLELVGVAQSFSGPPQKETCVVFNSRAEAYIWIDKKHDPDSQGVSRVRWGPIAKERRKERQGQKSIPLTVLDWVVKEGDVSEELIDKIETNRFKYRVFERAITGQDDDLLHFFGLSVQDGSLKRNHSKKETLALLSHFVRQIDNKTFDTRNLGKREQALSTLKEKIPADLQLNSDSELSRPVVLESADTPRPRQRRGRRTQTKETRKTLVFKDCPIEPEKDAIRRLLAQMKSLL